MRTKLFTGAIAAGATALVSAAYIKDLKAARKRIATGAQVFYSPQGPIEFAERGNGPAVLVIHGAGGGFDQGLDLARGFVGDDYHVIAPSRFGYLGTPLPADASAEAQADAHLALLDALHVDRVAVVGVSAGGPSALQLCLRHQERCSSLTLLVPLAYTPLHASARAPSKFFATVLNAITASDFLFWTAMKVAHATLMETILGTPVEVYRNAAPDERRAVDAMMRSILPISRRAAGIFNDGVVSSTLTRYPLEEIRIPSLIISAADDRYRTYENALYTAEGIPNATFVGFPAGGHLLVGHDAEIRARIATAWAAPPVAAAV